MIQVCDPPRQRQVRRLSAEEFFTLVRCGGAGFYRPCSEVLRMLTAGEAWGTAGAALLVLPLTADTAAAAALRNWLGRRQLEGGCLLTPPVNTGEELPTRLVEIAAARADRLRRKGTAWAVVECTETAAALLPLYFRQGFGLRALRPLESLAPCFLLCTGCAPVRTLFLKRPDAIAYSLLICLFFILLLFLHRLLSDIFPYQISQDHPIRYR